MSVIADNSIIAILKSNSGRLLSILLKVMIVGEAIAKLAIIIKVEIIEDGVSCIFVQLAYSSFSVQAFALVESVSICGSDSNRIQADKLASIDW